MSEWFGGRFVVFSSFFLAAIFTAITPWLAQYSFWCVFGIRVAKGVVGVSNFLSTLWDYQLKWLFLGCFIPGIP